MVCLCLEKAEERRQEPLYYLSISPLEESEVSEQEMASQFWYQILLPFQKIPVYDLHDTK